jgi:hypothetical protein
VDLDLPAAPATAVSADGTIAFGTYRGHTGPVDWSAVGRSQGRRAGAWKRWHYVSVAGSDVVAAVAVIDLGWAASAFGYLFDRTRRLLVADTSVLGLPRLAARVADRPSQDAATTFRSPGARVALTRSAGGSWALSASMKGLAVEAELHESEGSATLCAVAPVPGGVADCTHKTPGLRVEGIASAGGRVVDLAGHVAAIDHTTGLLARNTDWRWASAAGGGVAINFTEGFTAPAENAVWVGPRLERVGPVRFDFDATDPGAPWHIASDDGTVDLVFTPEGQRREDRSLGFAASRYVQPIGTFRGRAAGVAVDSLAGVTEDHTARW